MKIRRNLNTCLFAALVAAGASAFASTYYVDASRPDDAGGGTSWPTAKKTIQAAIDLTASGDLVLVTNGVYDTGGRAKWPAGSLLTNRVVLTNSVIVMAVSADPADTLIVGAYELWIKTGTIFRGK